MPQKQTTRRGLGRLERRAQKRGIMKAVAKLNKKSADIAKKIEERSGLVVVTNDAVVAEIERNSEVKGGADKAKREGPRRIEDILA